MKKNELLLNPEEIRQIEQFRQSKKTAILTIVFTDIVGYTKFTEEVGEKLSAKFRYIHDDLFTKIITRDGAGKIVKQIGDSFLAVFAEPSTAVSRALEFQKSIYHNKENLNHKRYTLKVRIGIHMGQVSLEDAIQPDIFGRQVNKTSRIESIAKGGQILTSKEVRDNAVGWLKKTDIKTKNYGRTKLKGFKDTSTIFEIYSCENKPIGSPKIIKRRKTRYKIAILFIFLFFAIGFFQLFQRKPSDNTNNFLLVICKKQANEIFANEIQKSLSNEQLCYYSHTVFSAATVSLRDSFIVNIMGMIFSEFHGTDINVKLADDNLTNTINYIDSLKNIRKVINQINDKVVYYDVIIVVFLCEETENGRSNLRSSIYSFEKNNCKKISSLSSYIESHTTNIINHIKSYRYGSGEIGDIKKVDNETVIISLKTNIKINKYSRLMTYSLYDFWKDDGLIRRISDLNEAVKYLESNPGHNCYPVLDSWKNECDAFESGALTRQDKYMDYRFSSQIRVIEVMDTLAVGKITSEFPWSKVRVGDPVKILRN